MNRLIVSIVFAALVALSCCRTTSAQEKNSAAATKETEKETRYLAFQIFTYYSPDRKVAALLSNGLNERLSPGTAALHDYVADIKQRIGIVGDRQTRLAVILGPLCFEQTDDEIADYIQHAFDLALEMDVAIGFHIDDSIFWLRRKDLWSDPKNVEAMDWGGTPSTGRRLDWGHNPTDAPPQMCFNSTVIQREVRQRSALIGKAIQAGVDRLGREKKPYLFAGVIAGWETMIGQDVTGKYLGYRALLNRGFTREHPPLDMDLEREKVVQEFIELWTAGLVDAGVSPQRIYSHTAFLSHRSFGLGDKKDVTYMANKGESSYSQHNHFAPPSAAFGANHRPGFSTYPQPGLFDDIYQELAAHQQAGWGSCEGTDMQPSSGPGQSGMNMETYLARVFNHGGTLVNIFAWGIGGEAMKKMNFRVVTEGEDALQAYRKFLKGEPLIEAAETASLMERLPPKIHKIQRELPAWIEKADPPVREQAMALMHKLEDGMKAQKFDEVEKAADSVLKLMGGGALAPAFPGNASTQSSADPDEAAHRRLPEKIARVKAGYKKWAADGRDPSVISHMMHEKFKPLLDAGKYVEAEAELDRVLEKFGKDSKNAKPSSTPTEAAPTPSAQDITEELRDKLAHNIGCTFLLFRTRVLAELKVTQEQKAKLDKYLQTLLPDAMEVLQKSNGERAKYNQKTHEERAAVLKDILSDGQGARLHQLELQKEGLYGPDWNIKELQITDAQREQFMAPIQETQQRSQALMAEIQKGANPDEIRPKALQLRLDLEVKLEALLTDAQKMQWKEMLGEPVDLKVIYGGL